MHLRLNVSDTDKTECLAPNLMAPNLNDSAPIHPQGCVRHGV